MFPIYHRRGDYACHRPAYLVTEKLRREDSFSVDRFRTLDGAALDRDAVPTCGSCGKNLPYMSGLDWAPAFETVED